MNKHNIPCVDIIWMNLQGAKLLALTRFRFKILHFKYKYIYIYIYMIIEEKKIIFCHVDKTAGSYISKNLNKSLTVYDHKEPIRHSDKHKIMKDLILKVKNPKDYYKIAFVRNPYDRALSKYYHHIKVDGGTVLEKLAKKLDFNDWIQKGGLSHFKPQYLYIYDNETNLCDFIGRFENLQKDYNFLKQKFNLDELVRLNENHFKKIKYYYHYYNKESLEYINKKYKKDFELFNYTKFETNLFDIVIPVGPNDKSVIEEQIKYTQKNIIGYRNIYLICYDPSIIINGCITIDENIFPFNIETVAKYHGKLDRNGWYLQQLLKLYAGKIIPDILDKYLVIDADTFFLKPTTFIENNKCLYNYGTEYHKSYFDHMEKLDKSLIKMDQNKSGICHHMIFETKYIDEILNKIENKHNDLFYNVFLKTIIDVKNSGASEYEIYFNFMLKNYPNIIQIRKLNWKNTNKLETNINLDYISYHWYRRSNN